MPKAADSPFKITTGDPLFDPKKPVLINGFLYAPVDRSTSKRPILPGRSPRGAVVEVKRRRLLVDRDEVGF